MKVKGMVPIGLLSVFFYTGKNRVVKITCFSFKIVLRTTKHTMCDVPALKKRLVLTRIITGCHYQNNDV
jgi:hypothetical protein